MKKVFVLTVMVLAFAANAKTVPTDRDLKIFTSEFDVTADAEKFRVVDMELTEVPSKVKYVKDKHCYEEPCWKRRVVLERKEVVQVRVHYKFVDMVDGEDSSYVKFNFPTTDFTATQLQYLEDHKPRIFGAKRFKARQSMARNLFAVLAKQAEKSFKFQKRVCVTKKEAPTWDWDEQDWPLCKAGQTPFVLAEGTKTVVTVKLARK